MVGYKNRIRAEGFVKMDKKLHLQIVEQFQDNVPQHKTVFSSSTVHHIIK